MSCYYRFNAMDVNVFKGNNLTYFKKIIYEEKIKKDTMC